MKAVLVKTGREAFALPVFCIEFRLFGQALEWEYGAPMIDLEHYAVGFSLGAHARAIGASRSPQKW